MFRFILSILLIPVFGCMGGGAPSLPPAAPPPPEQQDAGVTASRDAERMRRRSVASNTILTSATGVSGAAPTSTKTLLGA
jgi:hypothetical protein